MKASWIDGGQGITVHDLPLGARLNDGAIGAESGGVIHRPLAPAGEQVCDAAWVLPQEYARER
jgi:hypothetical protein